MKVLVTGGAGFIGSHIIDSLTAANHTVSVIDDLSSGVMDNLPDTVQLFQMDICDRESAHTAAQLEPEVIIHTAAQMSVSASMKDPSNDIRVNLAGMVNILNAVKDQEKLPYVLFLSTGGALYGEQDEFPAKESHPIRPTSVYGQSKSSAEQYLALWQRVYGLSYGVLRLANVYGPRQNPHGEAGVVAIFLEKIFAGEVPTINGSGDFTRDYVCVSDVVSAVDKMIKGRVEDTFNIGTGSETSVNDLFQEIINAAEQKIKPLYGQQRAGDQKRSVIDNSKAKELLGWQPVVDLESGIKTTADWFRQNTE